MREALNYSLIIGMSAAFLWFFSCIVRFGDQLVHEPSPAILVLEIIFLCAILTYGIVSLVKLLRRR